MFTEGYRYDAFGRRSRIETANDNMREPTDPATLLLGLINDGSDRAIDISPGPLGTATPVRRYTHGQSVDEPLQMEVFADDGSGTVAQVYTYHTDHLGSIRALTDSAGNISHAYDYDSYGNLIADVEPALEGAANPFRYTAREWDEASQLYHYRARQYDPTTGRFVQEDPIGFAAGDINFYRYVRNNPLSFTDPSGLVVATEKATTSGASTGGSAGMASIGLRLNCLFTAITGALEIAGAPDLETLDIVAAGAITALECGAKAKFKLKQKSKPSRKSKAVGCNKGGSSRCFAAGTLVHTEDGLKPIEKIKAGDRVKSMDIFTGEIAYKSVTKTHINSRDPVGLLEVVDPIDSSVTALSVTKSHPLFTVAKGWVHASKLKLGDLLIEDEGGVLRVSKVDFPPSAEAVNTYNLSVEEYQTYFVGIDGVLAHNGRGAAFEALLNNPKVSKALKGWIRNELNSGRRFWQVRTPPGYDLGHYPANRGSHCSTSRLEIRTDNRRRPGLTGNNPKWR